MVLYLEFMEIESRPLSLHEILWVLGCSGAQAGGGVAFLSGAQAPEGWLNWALGCRRGAGEGKQERSQARAGGGCRGGCCSPIPRSKEQNPEPLLEGVFLPAGSHRNPLRLFPRQRT